MKAKHIVFILLVSLILCSCKIVIDGDSVGYTGNEYYDFSYTGSFRTMVGDLSIGIPVSPSSGNNFHVISFAVTNKCFYSRYMDMYNSRIMIALSNGTVFPGRYQMTELGPGCIGVLNVYFEIPMGYSINNAKVTFSFHSSFYPYDSYASTCCMRLPSGIDS